MSPIKSTKGAEVSSFDHSPAFLDDELLENGRQSPLVEEMLGLLE
jgi:hypothetical protein